MEINMTDLTPIMAICTIISLGWGIRSHFRNYKSEDNEKERDFALFSERLSTLKIKCESFSTRISDLERNQSAMEVFRLQMQEDVKTVKQNVDYIIKLLLEQKSVNVRSS